MIDDTCKLANIPLKQLWGRGKHPWSDRLGSVSNVVLRMLSETCWVHTTLQEFIGQTSTVLWASCYWPERGRSGSVDQEGNTNVSSSSTFTNEGMANSHTRTGSLQNLFLKMTLKICRIFFYFSALSLSLRVFLIFRGSLLFPRCMTRFLYFSVFSLCFLYLILCQPLNVQIFSVLL